MKQTAGVCCFQLYKYNSIVLILIVPSLNVVSPILKPFLCEFNKHELISELTLNDLRPVQDLIVHPGKVFLFSDSHIALTKK